MWPSNADENYAVKPVYLFAVVLPRYLSALIVKSLSGPSTDRFPHGNRRILLLNSATLPGVPSGYTGWKCGGLLLEVHEAVRLEILPDFLAHQRRFCCAALIVFSR